MLLIMLVALVFWISLYLVLILSQPNEKYEWHCRIVTSVHALLIVVLSGWSVFIQGPWPFNEPAGPNTVLQEYTCAISYGYFIFDFCWCIYFRTEGPVMLFHHVLSMFGMTLILLRGINGCEMMAALFGTEVTNPLLQLRWFLRHTPTVIPAHFKVTVDLAFLALFTFMRIGLGSLLLVSYLSHPRPDVIARGGAISIYLVGWIFWIAVVKYAWRKYVLPQLHSSEHRSKKKETVLSNPTTLMNADLNGHCEEVDNSSQPWQKNQTSQVGIKETEQWFRHRTALSDGVLVEH